MSADNNTLLQIQDLGQVKGNIREINDQKVLEFLSIPYAEAPINELRFKKPVPVKPWSAVLDATRRRITPWQTFFRAFGGKHPGEEIWNPVEPMGEDCLHLNIWTPEHHQDMLPVMVWIYGGGFATGSANLGIYDGGSLAANGDVVVVSINYRIASLGFLYLDSQDAPGNQGLWDQLEALKWMKKNIATFGGDTENVTLFGESAGAVSISCHLISPYSQDLFRQAILQSGTALSFWGVLPKEEIFERSKKLVSLMLPNDSALNGLDSVENMLQKLMALSAEDLIAKDWLVEGMFQWPWVPIIDGDFLPETPQRLLESGRFKKCPLMLGTNSNEASYFLIYNQMNLFTLDDSLELNADTFMEAIRTNFSHYPHYPMKMSEMAVGAIAREYFPSDQNDSKSFYQQLDNAIGDLHLTCDTLSLADAYASAGQPVFVYLFAHRSSHHLWPKWAGVMHADEVQFIFGVPCRPDVRENYSPADVRVAECMLAMWTDFAKCGNPGSQWTRYNPSDNFYLQIGEELTVKSADDRRERRHFWHTVLPCIDKFGKLLENSR